MKLDHRGFMCFANVLDKRCSKNEGWHTNRFKFQHQSTHHKRNDIKFDNTTVRVTAGITLVIIILICKDKTT